jgi:hypothetical protein
MVDRGAVAMTRARGYTLAELIAVMGIALLVIALVGPLYLGVTRALDVEAARGELLAGAREVLHPLKDDVRQAQSLAVTPTRLSLVVKGQRVEYLSTAAGVTRRSGGSRPLGGAGIRVEFRPLGGRGVEVRLSGQRSVRSRTLTLERRLTIARRVQ